MNDIKSDLEKVVIELSRLTDKVIFKGGIINLNMINNAGYAYHRITKDIDLNTILTSSELAELIKIATETALGGDVTVNLKRETVNSMSFRVVSIKDNVKLYFEVDANKLKFDEDKVVLTRIENVYVKSQLTVTTLVDKLSVVTTPVVLRRVKDLHDVFAILNSDLTITLYDIEEELHSRNVILGESKELLNWNEDGKQSLSHAFSKQSETSINESLEEIIETVLRFLKSINFESTVNKVWDNEILIWRK